MAGPLKRIKTYLKSSNARIHIAEAAMLAGVAVIVLRLFWLQAVDADNYKEDAYRQYTSELTITAKRGTIYDRNMNELAVNQTVETVFLSPATIDDKDIRKIAEGLSGILGIDKGTIYTKMQKKHSQYEVIKRRIDRNTADNVRRFLADNNIVTGVHLEEDSKRYYPEGHLASHVIGFTNYDGDGAYGIEAQYNSVLKGVPGRIVTAHNGVGKDMPFKYESYIASDNGSNVVLTIDKNIQSFLEKNLEAALVDTGARNRVLGIVMDVKTGEILGMSTKPDYDPNDPTTLDSYSETLLALAAEDPERLTAKYNGRDLTLDEYRKELMMTMWTNKGVGESYEPGSTFKIVTSAMALEEGVVSETETFTCTGSLQVADALIHCHNVYGHGVESFEQGLQNSCNPVFMTLAKRLGKERFFNYFELFGLTEKTGVDLPAEARPIYHTSMANFNEVELAVYSFGQTFKVTPMSLLRAVSAVANGGDLVKPHIVKKLVDDDGNTIESYDTEVVRRVCSEETSKKIMTYLGNGITMGSTKNAYVKGYSIGAKTGTSQKRDKVNPETGEKDLYIGSCVAFAPVESPEVAVIVIIDEPQGNYYGGTIAAPVVGSILSDILPYLGIEPTETEDEEMAVSVLDYRGQSLDDVKRNISSMKLKIKVIGNGSTVTEQFPRAGAKLTEGGVIAVYVGDAVPAADTPVPDVTGMSASEANKTLVNAGFNINITGAHIDGVSGAVASKQNPAAGTEAKPGTVVTVDFIHKDVSD